MTDELLRKALTDLLRYVDRQTCTHEETHRGGAIWTICDGCGKKWDDDAGGFRPHQDAPEVARARVALTAPAGDAWEVVGYMDPNLAFALPKKGQCVLSSNVTLLRDPAGCYTSPLYIPAPPAGEVA